MGKYLAQQSSQASSAAVATWLQVVRSQAFVGLFLAVLIVLLAWPRLTGPPWTALQMPFDLRESEGNTLHWEHNILFDSFRATLQSDAASAVKRSYSTNQYRALLPTYVSAIFAWWLDSRYKGFALVDLLGWWVATWALYYLARRLDTDRFPALIAAVLLSASPLLVSKMWNQGLNVAHHSSLVPCFLIALIFFDDNRLGSIRRIAALTSVLYAASLTYQYHWIIAPFLLSLAVLDRRRWTCIISVVVAVVLFIAVTLLTYQIMSAAGVSVYSSLNDPLAAVNSRLTSVVKGGVIGLEYSLFPLKLLVKSYHPFIISLSILGVIFARTRLRILLFTGTVLALVTGDLYPLPWTAMNGYPFMYISAGLALVRGPRWLSATVAGIGNSRWPQYAARIASGSRLLARSSTVVLILLALWSTNTDLLGDYSFAQQWWDFTYVPR